MNARHPVPAPDRYVVLGNPVAHSRSPFIHHRFAEQTGQKLVYDRLLCAMDGFEAAVRRFAAEGGRGCNVTLPFKFEVPALAMQCTPRATLAAAANVLRIDEGCWLADNTDGAGLVHDRQRDAPRPAVVPRRETDRDDEGCGELNDRAAHVVERNDDERNRGPVDGEDQPSTLRGQVGHGPFSSR